MQEQKMEEQIAQVIQVLPLEIRQEVRDFIEFLLEKRVQKPKAELGLDWRGALSEWKDQFTSVELQHKALDWWSD
ncbi:MAG: DUF2281 domain-containing protein [Chloroflexota bacterium]